MTAARCNLSVSLRRRPCASADAQLCSKPDCFDSPGRLFWQRQEDSNHHQRFWRPPLYPLSYALMKRAHPEKTPRRSPQTYASITWCRNPVRSRPRLSGVSLCIQPLRHLPLPYGLVLVAGLEPATLLPVHSALPTELHQPMVIFLRELPRKISKPIGGR